MTLIDQSKDLARHLSPEGATIAVIGFHREPTRAAHYVPEYFHRRGYSIIPVNPALAEGGEEFFGHAAVSTLGEIQVPVDIVLIFRRSDQVYQHQDDILNLNPAPRLVWLQQGIRDDQTARRLTEAGIDVVQDRCMMVDHRSLT
ncbi:CoA-binding protein [Deinococcus radiophilus]|uniref:CoA-binding protein n=1 Tax=Deinococcus radiophilus TaxID=32062 RepID=A0A3S0KB31_9DEIO|nr:CoA-binding protein [Deinococcus radiophilus]RTR26683.1 CoA-binding protein [Deinococcus radiophilus]UFA50987.1 CoA-binding protein [Deinococcus radiophilus]